jgi:hypothetical protein
MGYKTFYVDQSASNVLLNNLQQEREQQRAIKKMQTHRANRQAVGDLDIGITTAVPISDGEEIVVGNEVRL